MLDITFSPDEKLQFRQNLKMLNKKTTWNIKRDCKYSQKWSTCTCTLLVVSKLETQRVDSFPLKLNYDSTCKYSIRSSIREEKWCRKWYDLAPSERIPVSLIKKFKISEPQSLWGSEKEKFTWDNYRMWILNRHWIFENNRTKLLILRLH